MTEEQIQYECSECGTSVRSGDTVCPKCGTNLEEVIGDTDTRTEPITEQVLPPFRHGGLLAKLAIWLLSIRIILELTAVVSTCSQIKLLKDIKEGHSITRAEARANDERQVIISIIQVLVILAGIIVFLMWIYRVYHNDILGIVVSGLTIILIMAVNARQEEKSSTALISQQVTI